MSVLSRWLAWRCLRAYLIFGISVALFFVIVDGFINLEKFGEESDLLLALAQRYGRQLPELFYLLSPFLTLISTLWVISALMRSNELVPLAAAGYSPRQIATPLLGMALAFAPLCWIDREVVLPRLADLRRAHTFDRVLIYPRPVADRENGVISGLYRPETQELVNAKWVQLDERGGELLTVLARTASPAEGGWTFHDGYRIRRAEAGSLEQHEPIGGGGLFVATTVRPGDLEASVDSPMYLSSEQLKEQIERTPGFRHLAVQYYERFAQPLAGLVLLLLSIPLVLDARGASFLRFVACTGLAGGYFVLSTVCYDLGSREVFHPALAAFLPLIICGAAGGVMIWRISR